MGLRDTAQLIENDNRQKVMAATWGHLAPVKNRNYKGRVVFACGCFDSGDLNPTPLTCHFKGLDSSPWFYDAIHEWLQELPEEFRQEGCVYEWTGTFLNYELTGKIRLLIDANN